MTSAGEKEEIFVGWDTREALNEQRCARLNIYIVEKRKRKKKRKHFHEQRLEKDNNRLAAERIWKRREKVSRVSALFETFQLSVPAIKLQGEKKTADRGSIPRSLNRAETRGEGKIILQRKIILRFVRFISRIRFINRMFRPGRAVIRSHGQRRAETRETNSITIMRQGKHDIVASESRQRRPRLKGVSSFT